MEKNPGRPFLSACLMVKDEERNIEKCLKSIQGIVDEIVIVDTGSTDRTMEIARSYGARIFEHPWENNFSIHRNQSIDYAEGKWVLIIDADEEFKSYIQDKEKTREQLFSFLENIPDTHVASAVVIHDIQKGHEIMTFNSTRLSRKGDLRYQGIVHNNPQIIRGSLESVMCEFIYINHYGYDLTADQKKVKYTRTNTLLRKRLEENIHDYDAMFYLCQLNAEGGTDNQEAIKWGERYLAARENIDPDLFNKSIYFTLFRLHLHVRQRDDAKRVLALGLEAIPGDIDLALGVLEFGVFDNDVDIKLEGAKAYLEIFNKLSQDPTIKGNRFIYSHNAHGLAYVLYHRSLTHLIEGVNSFRALLQVLEKLPPELRRLFLRDFKATIDNAGIPLSMEVGSPPPPSKENQSINLVTQTIGG